MRFVKNEWIKLWSQRSTWIMFILTMVGLIAMLGLNKYFSDAGGSEAERLAANNEDKEMYEQLLKEETDPYYKSDYERELALIEYRIDNDLPSYGTMTAAEGIDFGLGFVIVFAAIFTMVIAASIVSNEFGTGTIKMLLTRPAARWKILLSKLVTTLLFSVFMMVVGTLLSIILSYVLFSSTTPFTLDFVNDQIVATDVEYDHVSTILYSSASMLMTTLFAFMLSTLFGSSTLAVSLALGIYFMGSTLSILLVDYDFAKYIWFVNDLGQYANGSTPMIEGLTFGFSLTVNIVYAIIFLGVSFIYFTRRDVTA